MGPQGSGGTLNRQYSAEETLKASVSSEGRMNVLLWYRLVGALSGCFRTVFSPPAGHRELASLSCPLRQMSIALSGSVSVQ